MVVRTMAFFFIIKLIFQVFLWHVIGVKHEEHHLNEGIALTF